jgi:pSer/pThr/pTyr-binding forkhead associated (FHA) protein
MAAARTAGEKEADGLGASLGLRSGVFIAVLYPGARPVTSAGRHADSDIVLDDITVSQHHAEFRRENRKFQVVDVDSFDGTYVNRELVDSAVLANGDEIQMGKFRLVFLTTPTTA